MSRRKLSLAASAARSSSPYSTESSLAKPASSQNDPASAKATNGAAKAQGQSVRMPARRYATEGKAAQEAAWHGHCASCFEAWYTQQVGPGHSKTPF